MSIRIDNDRVTGATSPQTDATEQARSGGKSTSRSGVQTAGKDVLQMSSIAANLAKQGELQDADRANKIGRLAATYASGRYHTDSALVGRAILSNAINAPSGGTVE